MYLCIMHVSSFELTTDKPIMDGLWDVFVSSLETVDCATTRLQSMMPADASCALNNICKNSFHMCRFSPVATSKS